MGTQKSLLALLNYATNLYFSNESHINLLAVLNDILNKVTGPVARLINPNGIPEDWADICKVLRNSLKKNETALCNDLALLMEISSSPQEFHEKCQVKAIKMFPILKNAFKIKCFFGLVGYYRKFIPNFHKLKND